MIPFRPVTVLRLLSVAALSTAILSCGAAAHEFWLDPVEYQVESGGRVAAHLRNGQKFNGAPLAYFDRNFERFELIENGETRPVEGRMGDMPALDVGGLPDGLLVILHQTRPSTLTYKNWEKFAAFAEHKDFGDVRSRHVARGLPDEGFSESYTRFAKALVAIGPGEGSDAPTGMETEFVALTNPYTDDLGAGMVVQLLYRGKPRIGAQVEVFDRPPEGDVTISLYSTNSDGMAWLPVESGHRYLFDAVVLREMPEGAPQVWESLWAALTFAVP